MNNFAGSPLSTSPLDTEGSSGQVTAIGGRICMAEVTWPGWTETPTGLEIAEMPKKKLALFPMASWASAPNPRQKDQSDE